MRQVYKGEIEEKLLSRSLQPLNEAIMNTYEKTVKHYFHFYLLNLCKSKILTSNLENTINSVPNRNKTNNFNKCSIISLLKRTFQTFYSDSACFCMPQNHHPLQAQQRTN